MSHAHDRQERFVTDHPGSKRPRYASETGGTTRRKAKNQAKWVRRLTSRRRRETIAARSATARQREQT